MLNQSRHNEEFFPFVKEKKSIQDNSTVIVHESASLQVSRSFRIESIIDHV